MVAFAPRADGRPAFVFPNVFDLESPTGYYQEVVRPRQQRYLQTVLNDSMHGVRGAPGKAGEVGGERDEPAAEPQDQRAGAAARKKPKAKAQPKTNNARAAYPAGKRLNAQEIKLS
eukprot:67558-Pyramimonas_sp.AAC.1